MTEKTMFTSTTAAACTAPKGSATDRQYASPISAPYLQPQPQPQPLPSPIEQCELLIQVKRQISASSFETLKRLQARHLSLRGNPDHNRNCSFSSYNRSHAEEIDEETSGSSLLAAALSAWRRFRDHVKANLLDPALDEGLLSDLSRLGGVEGGDLDLGRSPHLGP